MDYKEKRKLLLEMKEAKAELKFPEAINLFIKSRKMKNLTESTVSSYHQVLTGFARFLESIEVSTLKAVIVEDVQEFIQSRLDEGNSAPTINKYIRSIRAFFNYLHSVGYITENPMEFIDNMVEEKRMPRTLNHEQVTALLNVPDRGSPIGYRNYVFLLLLLDTGIRLDEALSIRNHDIFWKERTIKVFGKSRIERTVPFGDFFNTHLIQYAELRPESDSTIFFLNIEGKPLKRRTIQEEITEYGAQAKIKGVRVSCHTLRYTFARNYVINGADTVSFMKIMGHKSLHMAQLYAEMFQADIKKQHSKFSPVNSILS
ncbi:tyrosine-type recombinase/integrase [Paenibacillus mesotrionivorans]|uniref:Tyrosine-type recombinase/integrase n=1 Tax=Paenibacillus mesotrionivorans TaxID=3160968 RepID=A0ACC7P0Z0_9BACL